MRGNLVIALSVAALAACEGSVGSIDDPIGGDPSLGSSTHGNDPNGAPDPGGKLPPKKDAGTSDGGDPVAPPPPPPTDGGAPPVTTDSGTPSGPTDSGSPPVADTSPPPPPTGYPSGPYGWSVGNVFPNVTLHGYVGGSGAWTTITMQSYYDPDGTRHVNALMIDVSASWCGACRSEAGDLPGLSKTYAPRGGRFLTALIEDVSSSPAGQPAVDDWQASFHLPFDVAADPSRALLAPGGVGLPHNYLIDTRTMTVVKVWEGADPGATTVPGMDALLTKNGA